MNDRISQALVKLFRRNRIVFGYDAKQKLRGDSEALSLPGIEKIEIKNNEYPCPITTKDGLTWIKLLRPG